MKKEVRLIENNGELSYCFENDKVKVFITELSGRMTADFHISEAVVNPYYLAPWWEEETGENESAMRGCWFCFPFGLNKPYQNIQYPVHGFPVTTHYEKTAFVCRGREQVLYLKAALEEDHALLEKKYTLIDGESCIYLSDRISGAKGKYPVGYHPTLRVPEKIGSAFLDFSKPLESWTAPVHIEDPAEGGYSCLAPGHKITDMEKVPTIYGNMVDLTHHPFIKGFDDIYMHISNPSKEFCYTTLGIPEEGYLYFQLKNPRNLGNNLVWTSNNGRYYAPWNGRVNGCIGLEEINGYFCYGITSLQEELPFMQKDYHMYDEFNEEEKEYRMIQGIVEIDHDYPGVENIVKVDEEHIAIIGKDGSKKLIACRTGFLENIE